jgi:uncharacterized protein YutE (UPF0331/DUF86 family)
MKDKEMEEAISTRRKTFSPGFKAKVALEAIRASFSLLTKGKIIPESLSKRLQSMVSFRNIAVHDYTQMNLEIVRKIIEFHLDEFLEFTKTLIKASAAKL